MGKQNNGETNYKNSKQDGQQKQAINKLLAYYKNLNDLKIKVKRLVIGMNKQINRGGMNQQKNIF